MNLIILLEGKRCTLKVWARLYGLNRSYRESVDNFKKQSLTTDSLEMTGPPTVVHGHVCVHKDFKREKWV